jgi:hypothetical protein
MPNLKLYYNRNIQKNNIRQYFINKANNINLYFKENYGINYQEFWAN